MSKTVILGGSFDPVTKGHAALIKNLTERFSRTVVVPCKVSPFKIKTSGSTDHRLVMLKEALSGVDCEISMFEIESKGPNYSYLTVQHFFDGTPLYFAIGSEMLADLSLWYEVRKLCEMAVFYVIPRPGYPVKPEAVKKLEESGIRLEIADFEGESGSSSEVKIALAAGDTDAYLDPRVSAYIRENRLYEDYYFVNDLYKKYHLKEKRILHSYSTAMAGIKLAKRLLVDTERASIALLLHDIGKYVTDEEVQSLGLKMRDEYYEMPPLIRHAETGAEILKQIENISDNGIIDAVRWHTTGKAAMTKLEIVVYLADCIEPMRDYPGVDYIRRETEKSVLDGLYAALENAIDYVNKEKLYHTTLEAYEYYRELLKK